MEEKRNKRISGVDRLWRAHVTDEIQVQCLISMRENPTWTIADVVNHLNRPRDAGGVGSRGREGEPRIVTESHLYKLRIVNPEFAKEWDEIMEFRHWYLEQLCLSVAFSGGIVTRDESGVPAKVQITKEQGAMMRGMLHLYEQRKFRQAMRGSPDSPIHSEVQITSNDGHLLAMIAGQTPQLIEFRPEPNGNGNGNGHH